MSQKQFSNKAICWLLSNVGARKAATILSSQEHRFPLLAVAIHVSLTNMKVFTHPQNKGVRIVEHFCNTMTPSYE